MIIENLTDDNFLIECAKYYKNKQCQSTKEFLDDLNRIKYIKKLITKYIKKKLIDERLILNHIVILNNVFGPVFLCRILFLKLLPQMSYIKPFLLYLNLLQDVVYNVNNINYNTVSIPMDWEIVNILRNLHKKFHE